ncbi:VOC family protein [Nocardioides sp. URHA0032]|uniref:VOC family protein n=1 Tax=Nocardioides sp. URHA0032 TaxID=1380388 RepID=UPI00048CF313|nr:VOC family protein [Nocardioides sp. URHA0032]
MSTVLNPYLNFRAQARDAMTFYQSALGGQLDVTTFADQGGMGVPESEAGLVMHSALTVSDGVQLMGADVPSHMDTGGDISNGSISLSGDDEATLRGWFEALSAGGSVTVPLEKAPWGDSFGMFTDKYGIGWMVNISGS